MLLVKSTFLKQSQMEEILDEFSQEVSKGSYERMPYSVWKSLKEAKLVGCYLYSDSDNKEELRVVN